MKLDLRVMGTVNVVVDGEDVTLPGVKPKQLLTALLLGPNKLVPVDRLVEALWSANPPRSALDNLRTYSTEVRRALYKPRRPPGACLTTSRVGYTLQIPPNSLDLATFTDLVATATAERTAGRIEDAASSLGQALQLWRGAAAEGLPREGWLGRALQALDEQRLTAAEDLAACWLDLGRHVELVPELTRRVAEHPLRERGWHQLMLTHYRSGRTAEALRMYRRARQLLIEELGVEPGPELTDLHRAILARDPALEETCRPRRVEITPVPAGKAQIYQVPAGPADFIGREQEQETILAALSAVHQPQTVSVTGSPGIGKSALAMRVAYLVKDRFPDGLLYVDLRDVDQEGALVTLVVASRLLRAVGQQVPPGACAAEASAMLRSALARRRSLIMLDNAVEGASLTPLLPACPGSAAIITSPRRLGIEHISQSVTLRPLQRAQSLALLECIIGGARAQAEPDAAQELAGLCYGVPLAIRAVAERLLSRPSWSLAMLREELSSSGHQLQQLRYGDSSLHGQLELALAEVVGIQPGAARLLAVLSALPGTFDRSSVELLAGRSGLGEATCDGRRRLALELETLVDFHLLESDSPEEFRMPELIRVFATELAGRQHDVIAQDCHARLPRIPIQGKPRLGRLG